MKNSTITKSNTGPSYGGNLSSEAAAKAYKEVAKAYDLRRRPFAVLQRIARAFLKWDDTADKSVRRELQNFASMKLSEENTSWFAEKAFRECFLRALTSSTEQRSETARERRSGGRSLLGKASCGIRREPDGPQRLL